MKLRCFFSKENVGTWFCQEIRDWLLGPGSKREREKTKATCRIKLSVSRARRWLPSNCENTAETQEDLNQNVHLSTWKTREPTGLIPKPGSYAFKESCGWHVQQDKIVLFLFFILGTTLKHEIGCLKIIFAGFEGSISNLQIKSSSLKTLSWELTS